MSGLKDLSLFDLQLLVDVADLASVRGAARARGLTPSHASKILLRAERKVGFRLFSRSSAGVTVTREGLGLVGGLREVLRAAEALTGGEHGDERALGVGAVSFLSHELVAPNLAELAALDEKRRYRLLDLPPDELVGIGIRGAVDLVVHAGRLEWPATWSQTALGPLHWVLIGRAGHALGKKTVPEKLVDVPFIVPTYWRGDGFSVGNDFCPMPWSERRKGHEASTASTAVAIAQRTDHVAFVPEVAARGALERGEVVAIDVRGWSDFLMPVFLSVKADAVPARLQKRFASVLTAYLSA